MFEFEGIALKNVKRTYGREGEGFLCSIYMDGKKIGQAGDYGDGGPTFVSIEPEKIREFHKRRYTFFTKYPARDFQNMLIKVPMPAEPNKDAVSENDWLFTNDEAFINFLYHLSVTEKELKKACKHDSHNTAAAVLHASYISNGKSTNISQYWIIGISSDEDIAEGKQEILSILRNKHPETEYTVWVQYILDKEGQLTIK